LPAGARHVTNVVRRERSAWLLKLVARVIVTLFGGELTT
jgi:hypothetical protein